MRYLSAALLLLSLTACGDDGGSGDGADLSCDVPPLTAEDCPEGWVFSEVMEETPNGPALDTQCTGPDGRRWVRFFYPEDFGGGFASETNDIEETVFSCASGAETGEYGEWTP